VRCVDAPRPASPRHLRSTTNPRSHRRVVARHREFALRGGDLLAQCHEGQVLFVDAREIGREFGGVGFEGGDDVLVSRRDRALGATSAFALLDDRRRAPRPFGQSLQRAERRGEQLSSRRLAISAAAVAPARRASRVRDAISRSRTSRPARSVSSVATSCSNVRQARGEERATSVPEVTSRHRSNCAPTTAWRSSGRIWRRTSRTRSPRRSRFSWVVASRRSARSLRRRCFKTPGRLFDDRASILRGLEFKDRIELALTDDHVLLASDARVAQQFLDVEQATRRAVDRVLRVAVAKEGARDGDFRAVDREATRGVVEREGHLGAAEGRAVGGAHEDDVVHLRRCAAPGCSARRGPR
jgi:hypothetical protein